MSFNPTQEEANDLQPVAEENIPLTTDTTEDLPISVTEELPANAAEEPHVKPPKISRSLIGKAVFVKGDLSAKEDLLINGCVEGSISLKTNTLEIGVNGHIHANVFAKIVVIGGELVGDVYASDRVIVTRTGRVTGDIYTADVSIDDGANIKGNIDMQRQDVFEHQTTASHESIPVKKRGFSALFKKRQLQLEKIETNDSPTTTHQEDNLFTLPSDALKASYDNCSMLGETVMIKGELAAGEDVVIQGQLDGTIYFKNHNLGISSYSKVKGNIFAKSLVVYGEVKGDIYAHDLAIVKKAGRVYGNIYSPRVTAERGAILMGTVEMGPQNIEEELNNVVGHSAIEHVCHQVGRATDKIQAAMENSGESLIVQQEQDDSGWPIFYLRS